MTWLARMEVDACVARMSGMVDSYAWHKKLWDCYPDAPASKRDFLTRIDFFESMFRIWMLGPRKPVRPEWCPPEGFTVKEIAPTFFSHRFYAFDLKANPIKTIVQRGSNGETLFGTDGKRKHGKRVPLVKPDELRDWLNRKRETRCLDSDGRRIPSGFRVLENKPFEISPVTESHFRKKGISGCHGGVQFRGTLEVTDPEHFMKTYCSGVGSAKGFGFGLMLLAPVKLD